jgi:hypothetical protein
MTSLWRRREGCADNVWLFGIATSQTVYNPAMTYNWHAYQMFFIDRNRRIPVAWRGF